MQLRGQGKTKDTGMHMHAVKRERTTRSPRRSSAEPKGQVGTVNDVQRQMGIVRWGEGDRGWEGVG